MLRNDADGWHTRPWSRSDIALIRPWWRNMEAAGYGDWGDGPREDEFSLTGCLAELDGAPVSCVFLYVAPSSRYAALYGTICDVSFSPLACMRGITMACKGAISMCRDMGIPEIITHARTPSVLRAFEMAGFEDAGLEINDVYLSEEVAQWLAP